MERAKVLLALNSGTYGLHHRELREMLESEVPALDVQTCSGDLYDAWLRCDRPLILLDSLYDSHWPAAVERIRRHDRSTPVILIARSGSEDLAIAALRAGVSGRIGLGGSTKPT